MRKNLGKSFNKEVLNNRDELVIDAELNFSVTFRHLDPSPSMKRIAIDKLTQRISKYYHGFGDVHLVFTVEKLNKVAEVHFVADGIDMMAKATTNEMYSSIDKLADTLETQLRKRKEKLSTHRVVVDKSSGLDENFNLDEKLAA